MKLEDLIVALTEKGLKEDEIKEVLLGLKKEIEEKLEDKKEETDDEKEKRIFGLNY